MSTHRRLLQTFSVIVILSMMFSGFSLPVVSAQEGDGIERQVNAQTGKVSFIGPENGRMVPATKALGISPSARPADPGMALAKRFGPEFGLKDPARDLTGLKTNLSANGRRMFRYQQNYEGVPVMGGELIVNTNGNGDLYSMNGEISPDLSLSTQPTVDPGQAQQAALEGAARWYQKGPEDFVASTPELWIFDESLLQPSTRPVELVWRMEVTPKEEGMPVRELVLVNAERGSVSLHFNQIDTAWGETGTAGSGTTSSAISTRNHVPKASAGLQAGSVVIETYTGNNSRTTGLPGEFVCDQSMPLCSNGDDLDADYAQAYAIGTYNFYYDEHGRLGIDDNNMDIISTVDYCDDDIREACPYDNAYWSGAQMVYGSSETYARADDIVTHELTHGVTQYASNLFYYYQSGAINESFSDLWAEYYDQSNGQGSDAGYEWLIGEDVVGVYDGPFRSMSNPPAYGDPDRMSHGFYYTGTGDNGGVHYNSGINNKAVYLMVEGDASSGVTGIGWEKSAAIYYEVNTNMLTSGADYSDLYYALQQACSNLIGENGITGDDCVEVKDAIDAVEMNTQPEPSFNTDVPYCDAGDPVATVFSDSLESGTGNWTFSNGAHQRWQLDSIYGPYAHSGAHSLYANDLPVEVTDAIAQLTPVTIPNNAYLHFSHAYEFDTIGSTYYDGGVLEYRIAGQSNWIDADYLIGLNDNKYKGTIATGYNNPLADHPAFVGASHGYINTRVNLSTLAGKIVTFRWRMGLDRDRDVEDDTDGYGWGWWVDDVKVYRCPLDMVAPAAIIDLSAVTGTTGGTVDLSWTAPGDDGATGTASSYLVRYSSSAITDETTWNAATPVTSGIPTPLVAGSAQTMTVSGLVPEQTYYFAVRAQDEEPNQGALSNSPSAAAQSCTANPGTYDDAYVGWIYTGSWSTYSGSGPLNNTMHYTNATGATASLKFQAPAKFILYFQKAANRSNILVSVDGGAAVPVNAYNSTGLWQQTYTSAMYSDTNSHTVT
ncbi:MAG TPA: M4 family metallopeptidase, partial [Anaerolineales bacterium]|nr:M4 family metallopeptidase [Anaerolineales bacterium]